MLNEQINSVNQSNEQQNAINQSNEQQDISNQSMSFLPKTQRFKLSTLNVGSLKNGLSEGFAFR